MAQTGQEDTQLRKWFEAIDVDKNNELDATELQRALGLGNLHFSLKSVAQMIRIHDSDRSGTINFAEFQRLHVFLTNMQKSYQHFDNDHNGELDEREIQQALQHAGFRLDGPVVSALFNSFDVSRRKQIGLPEYIAMTLFLQSASATFRAFDPQQQGQITLTFDQWIYAASNVM